MGYFDLWPSWPWRYLRRTFVARNPRTYTTLYSFKGGLDGANPFGGVAVGESGVLYGTTLSGGSYNVGTIFKLSPSHGLWVEAVLHTFSGGVDGDGGSDGAAPGASLVFGGSGALYGTTVGGGAGGHVAGAGTVFQSAPSKTGEWAETVLYGFDESFGSHNYAPQGAVLVGADGTLYTTASSGTAVAIRPPAAPGGAWTGSVIASPRGTPRAGFVSQGGVLYGTTAYGGDIGGGWAYELQPPSARGQAWTVTTIHNFGAFPPDGNEPTAPLTVGAGGAFYGTTFDGGSGTPCAYTYFSSGCGTVFELTPPPTSGGAWTEIVLYSFAGQSGDGAYPVGPAVVGENGVLYGTTLYGGDAGTCEYYGVTGCGTVFQLTPPSTPGGVWTETILHNFTGQNEDGAAPWAGLALGSNGQLYGTTVYGGSAGLGTVFVIKPN